MDTNTTTKADALYARANMIGNESPEGKAIRVLAAAQMTFEADREEIVRLASGVRRNAADIRDAIQKGQGTPSDFVAQTAVKLADYLTRDRGNVVALRQLARMANQLGIVVDDSEIF